MDNQASNAEILGKVSSGSDLTMQEMSDAINQIMQGNWPAEQIALLLTAINAKGPAVDEVAGAAAAMRLNMTPIRSSRTDLLDTCGTGGDGSGTFNISTAAALVTAAAGVPVAKHGNRSMSSKTGSADVLAQLGVNIEASVEQVERCLEEIGICFCFAPLMHQSMKHVGQVRRDLGVPTIFNLLGPLCNPASAAFQLLGVGKPQYRELMANALLKLGTTKAVLVTGVDGLDEVTLSDTTLATEVTPTGLRSFEWTPEEFGLTRADKSTMQVETPEESANMIREIFSGKAGPARDIVVLNAAAAIWTTGKETELNACRQQAEEAIDSLATSRLLTQLAEVSNS
ncbi:MAG: anthranilate phosphoribosyltransferase [Blastopirellula sp.]|nr:MAG: anthranilate phosphoribosyltransferase [Blastopirellula sp.]